MARYKYKALTAQGTAVQGIYEAKSKDDVLIMLRQHQYFPVSIVLQSEGREIELKKLFKKVGTKDIAVFCRQFYSMLNAGVSLISCLDILRQQTENKHLKNTLSGVFDKVQQGLTLSEAMRKNTDVFPELLINMIVAGEASGNLDAILDRMAAHYERETKISGKVKGAMMYPLVLAIVAVFVVIFLLTFVLPQFIGMFESNGAALPLPTRMLMAASRSLTGYWYLYLIAVIAVAALFRRLLKVPKVRYKLDWYKLKLPVLRVANQKLITSRFARTLATLISSGMPLLQALDIVSKIVNNKYVEHGLTKVREDVSRGVLLSTPIKEMNLFPPMLVSMIAVGEESGELEAILNRTASYYDEEAETAMEAMTRLVEPLMLVVMAVLIGSIVAAMILPLFDMMTNVQM